MFKKTTSQIYQSLKKLNILPNNTLIYYTHKYTLSNIKFTLNILPHNLSINNYYHKIKKLQTKNQITLPIILKNKQQINIFLKTKNINLINIINKKTLLQQPKKHFT